MKRIPDILEEIPSVYFHPADHQGSVEVLKYNTWEAFSYSEKIRPIQKEALVYLPYQYDEKKRYNIFYLMHGGWGNERTYLGPDEPGRKTPFRSYGFRNMIDHAIEDGRMEPLIIVCPTYNNTSGKDSGDYELALRLTRLYPEELVNDLMPAVESRYSTWAEKVSYEGLKESRDHRCFGGFSMGSVTTWHVFDECLDLIHYFIPMSGNCSDGSLQDEAVRRSGLKKDDFFIFAAAGSDDFAHESFRWQIMNMGTVYTDSFQFGSTEKEGNLSYREKKGAVHDYAYAAQYIYNALQFFWSGK